MRKTPFQQVLFLVVIIIFTMIGIDAGESQMSTGKSSSRIAAAGSHFGLNLFSRLDSSDGNIFFSPASIMWCLSMVVNGAEEETREELLKALEMHSINISDLNRAFGDWKQSWNSIDPGVEIEVANSIWSRAGITVRPEFLDVNRKYFDASVSELDFNDPRSLSVINLWVKNKTRGKIERIIDQISGDSVLFLINAIYFNGRWSREFEASKTKEDHFITGSAKKIVPMMRQNGLYRYQEQPEFQAISLPYGNGRLSMYIFLPSESTSFKTFSRVLTAAKWEKWMSEFEEAEGEIVMPRFQVNYDTTLNESLKSIGVRSAFDPHQADFGSMVGGQGKVYISAIKHKAVAEVTEKGTVAAAATSTEMRVVSMPVPKRTFRMIVNRPFLFTINDNSTGLILFMGAISNPQEI